jgi:hypothetical protein
MTDEQIESMANACGLYGVRKAVVRCVRELLKAHPDHPGDGGEKTAGCTCGHARSGFPAGDIDDVHETWCAQGAPVPQDGDEQERFDEWYADNCPEFQRTQYSAGDVEANVRSVAESAWQTALASSKAAAVAVAPSDDAMAVSDAMRMDDDGAIRERCPSRCAHPSWKSVGIDRAQCEICGAIGSERRYLQIFPIQISAACTHHFVNGQCEKCDCISAGE